MSKRRMILIALALVVPLFASCAGRPPSTPRPLSITEPFPGTTMASSSITVRGTAPAGSRIVHDVPGGPDQETAADGSGAWAMGVVLGAGDNTLTFRIGDAGDTAQSITVRLAASAFVAPPVTTPTDAPTVAPEPTAKPTRKPPEPTTKPTRTPKPSADYYVPRGWSGGDVDCPDFNTHRQAQSFFKGTGGTKTNDPHGLDSDHDGLACESLP